MNSNYSLNQHKTEAQTISGYIYFSTKTEVFLWVVYTTHSPSCSVSTMSGVLYGPVPLSLNAATCTK